MVKKEKIEARVTKEEKEMIKRKAEENGMTISSYILNSVEKNVTINLDTSDYRNLVIQFRRIGNNINSIIRDIRFSNVYSDTHILEIQNNLKTLNKIMDQEKKTIIRTKNEFEKLTPSKLKNALEKENYKIPKYLIYDEIEEHIILQLRYFVDLIIQEKLNETYPPYIDYFIKNFNSVNFIYDELVNFSDELDEVINRINRKVNTKTENLNDEDFLSVMNVLDKYRKVSDN